MEGSRTGCPASTSKHIVIVDINYNILSINVSLQGNDKIWWLSDRLTVNKNSFVLEIDMQDFDSQPEEFTFVIKFERAEVNRQYSSDVQKTLSTT